MTRSIGWLACALGAGLLGAPRLARGAEIEWKGYTWSVTDGGMAGVAAGSPANVSVDTSGYLHLKVQKNGSTWTAAEIFTTTRLGFGTYQWQIDGPIDTLDKNVVLGLFPYGPAAGIGRDGTNEIDIEYSRWGQANGPNGDWTNYPASGTTIGELSYSFSLDGGTLSTSRFVWTSSFIEDFLLAGLQPLSSTQSLLKSWKYSPSNATTNIPQQALPLGMNLWCYDIPSDGKDAEIVVRDFQFVPEGTNIGGAGGAGGTAGPGTGGADDAGASTGGAGAISAAAGTTSSGGTTAGSAGASSGGTTAHAGQAQAEAAAGKVATPPGDVSGCRVGHAPGLAGCPACGLALLVLVSLARARRRRS